MKKLLATCAALLFVVSSGWAQTYCLDFDPYCDGLEVTNTGGSWSGYWRNTDCAGTDVAIQAGILPSGTGYVLCDYPSMPCPGSVTWGFLIDLPPDGTMQMYQGPAPNWTVWIDPLNYDLLSGPCPFAPEWYNSNTEASWMNLEQNQY